MADEIPIIHPSIATPTPGAGGLHPILIDDIIEPRYPNGAELVFMRPGELAPAVPAIPIPKGAMVMMIAPEQAVHIREAIKRAVEAAQAQTRAAMNGLGRRG